MAGELRPGGRRPAEDPIDIILQSWGANNCGQLGTGQKEDILEPSTSAAVYTLAPRDGDKIHSVGGGGGFSYIHLESGQLLTCGNNDRGQLGLGNTENVSIFTQCTLLAGLAVRKVTAGWDFMLAITDNGSLLSWGSNSFGQLGRTLNPGLKYDPSPGPVSSFGNEPIIDISAGLRHVVALTGSNKVYTWGHGRKGQLGLTGSDGKPVAQTEHPQLVNIASDSVPTSVVAGMYHSGVVTAHSDIYMWGCNKYGQCCEDPEGTKVVEHPRKIPLSILSGGESTSKVVEVTSGWTHLVLRTASGDVFSWGRADLGQLGRQCQKTCDHMPQKIPGLSGVISHVCGSEHNLALTADGHMFSWGWNEHGICGTGDEQNVFQPIRIPAFVGKRVSAIGCGAGHSFCVIGISQGS